MAETHMHGHREQGGTHEQYQTEYESDYTMVLIFLIYLPIKYSIYIYLSIYA